jgi:RNA polymerase sigma-70 factor (ECF subfamily)
MDPGLTDEQLVAQVLLNKDQFRYLVERYQHKLMRYIFRIGGQDAGEDLLQEVFINAYQNLSGFNQSLSFSAWIYRIAHNIVISHFRKQKVRPEGNLHGDSEDILAKLYGQDDVEQAADLHIDSDRLHVAMAGLKSMYRDILVLRYFEQLEYQEISDVLRVPMGSVAVYLHRAKKQLKDLYDKN